MTRALVEPSPPDSSFPRVSDRAFPRYRFVPGLNAHPTAHAQGHSFGHVEPDLTQEAALLRSDWRQSPQFRFGVDLYNFAYWWEAHETWEGLWHCFAFGEPLRHALQFLIQVSAAHLKRHVEQPRGVEAILKRAAGHLGHAGPAGDVVFGVRLAAWWEGDVLPYFAGSGAARYPFLRSE